MYNIGTCRVNNQTIVCIKYIIIKLILKYYLHCYKYLRMCTLHSPTKTMNNICMNKT